MSQITQAPTSNHAEAILVLTENGKDFHEVRRAVEATSVSWVGAKLLSSVPGKLKVAVRLGAADVIKLQGAIAIMEEMVEVAGFDINPVQSPRRR